MQTMSQNPTKSNTKSGADKRIAIRYEVNNTTSCPFVLPIQHDLGKAKIKDVSTEGVGLWMPDSIEPGTLLAIGLSNPSQNFFRTMIVQVVHSTPNRGGGYHIGGAFLTPLSYEELRSMLM